MNIRTHSSTNNRSTLLRPRVLYKFTQDNCEKDMYSTENGTCACTMSFKLYSESRGINKVSYLVGHFF